MNTHVKSPVKVKFSVVFLFYALLMSLFFSITSCSSDEEPKPNTSGKFAGTYAVKDLSAKSGYTYEYDVTITTDLEGNLNISNFADMVKVPVKATVEGNNLTVNPQSFTNPSSNKTLTVFGSGSLSGDVLNFTYTTEGYLDYEGTCVATKKQ